MSKLIERSYKFTNDAVFIKSLAALELKEGISIEVFNYDDELTKRLFRGVQKLRRKHQNKAKTLQNIGANNTPNRINMLNGPAAWNEPPQLPHRITSKLQSTFSKDSKLKRGYEFVSDDATVMLASRKGGLTSKPSGLTSVEEIARNGGGGLRPLPPTPKLNRKSLSAFFVAEHEDPIQRLDPLLLPRQNVKQQADDSQKNQLLRNSENDYDEIDKLEQPIKNQIDKLEQPIKNEIDKFKQPIKTKTAKVTEYRKNSNKFNSQNNNLTSNYKLEKRIAEDLPTDELDELVIFDDQIFSDEENIAINSTCFALPKKLSGKVEVEKFANVNNDDAAKLKIQENEIINLVMRPNVGQPKEFIKRFSNISEIQNNNIDNIKKNEYVVDKINTAFEIVKPKPRSKSEEILKRSNFNLSLQNPNVINNLKYYNDSSDLEYDKSDETTIVTSDSSREFDCSNNDNLLKYDIIGQVENKLGSINEKDKVQHFYDVFQQNFECLIIKKNELVIYSNVRQDMVFNNDVILLQNKAGLYLKVPHLLLHSHDVESFNPFLYPHPLTEKQATYFLQNETQNGAFLLYSLDFKSKDYRLSLRYGDIILHHQIVFKQEGYYVVENTRKRFYRLLDLIDFYRSNRDELATSLTLSIKDNKKTNKSILNRFTKNYLIKRQSIHFDGKILGQNHFGIICLGDYAGEVCVIKTFVKNDINSLDYFRNEIYILSMLNHSNIIKFLGFTDKVLPYYLIVEYCVRRSLNNYSVRGQLNLRKINFLIFQMLSAVVYLKQLKYIIHRDVCLKNFYLTTNDVVKLSEFGSAKHVFEDSYTAELDEQIHIKYASIEVLQKQIYSTKSDIWSLAISTWELFAGEEAFSRLNAKEIIKSVSCREQLQRPDLCPVDTFQALRKCWRIDPIRRPTAEVLLEYFRCKLRHSEQIQIVSKKFANETEITEAEMPEILREDSLSTKNKIKQTIKRFSFNKKK